MSSPVGRVYQPPPRRGIADQCCEGGGRRSSGDGRRPRQTLHQGLEVWPSGSTPQPSPVLGRRKYSRSGEKGCELHSVGRRLRCGDGSRAARAGVCGGRSGGPAGRRRRRGSAGISTRGGGLRVGRRPRGRGPGPTAPAPRGTAASETELRRHCIHGVFGGSAGGRRRASASRDRHGPSAVRGSRARCPRGLGKDQPHAGAARGSRLPARGFNVLGTLLLREGVPC